MLLKEQKIYILNIKAKNKLALKFVLLLIIKNQSIEWDKVLKHI